MPSVNAKENSVQEIFYWRLQCVVEKKRVSAVYQTHSVSECVWGLMKRKVSGILFMYRCSVSWCTGTCSFLWFLAFSDLISQYQRLLLPQTELSTCISTLTQPVSCQLVCLWVWLYRNMTYPNVVPKKRHYCTSTCCYAHWVQAAFQKKMFQSIKNI